jgi:hypothetical protein
LRFHRESVRLNPNRRRRAELRTLQHSASHSLYVLEQLTEYLSDLTRTLVEASDDRTDNPRPEDGVTALYSHFLHRVADPSTHTENSSPMAASPHASGSAPLSTPFATRSSNCTAT